MKNPQYACPEAEQIKIETRDIMSASDEIWGPINPGMPVE